MRWRPRTNKYRAVRVQIDGEKFDSKAEAARWQNLKFLERAGQITQLERQPRYELLAWTPDGPKVIGHFRPDARYVTAEGEVVVEDTKSPQTAAEASFRLRRRIWEANTGLVLTEVLT